MQLLEKIATQDMEALHSQGIACLQRLFLCAKVLQDIAKKVEERPGSPEAYRDTALEPSRGWRTKMSMFETPRSAGEISSVAVCSSSAALLSPTRYYSLEACVSVSSNRKSHELACIRLLGLRSFGSVMAWRAPLPLAAPGALEDVAGAKHAEANL